MADSYSSPKNKAKACIEIYLRINNIFKLNNVRTTIGKRRNKRNKNARKETRS